MNWVNLRKQEKLKDLDNKKTKKKKNKKKNRKKKKT